MQHFNNTQTSHSLLRRSTIRLGGGLVVALVALCALPAADLYSQTGMDANPYLLFGMLLLAIAAGTLVRGCELRAYFGTRISWHQSQSLQLILDFARWISPLMQRRRFEVELIARESGFDADIVAAWSRSRQWWRAALLPALSAIVCTTILLDALSSAITVAITLIVIAISTPLLHLKRTAAQRVLLRKHFSMLGCALLALVIEGALLLFAARHVFDAQTAQLTAATALVALTLSRAVPATSFGIGMLQVLAVAGALWLQTPQIVWFSLAVHAGWLLLSCAAATPYLSRYKLTVSDLFDRRLPVLLGCSRRPVDGWHADEPGAYSGIDISVAIPAYNERQRLPVYLPKVLAYLSEQAIAAEVIVVDDGSSDGTAQYVEWVARSHRNLRLVRRPCNGGKGRAVLDAVHAANGRYILIADADGATPIHELKALYAAALAGAEIAIGSRTAPSAGVRNRRMLRALLGRVFYGLVNLLAVPGVGDTQCGFKLLRRDVARSLFRELGEYGWAFDVEILYRAQLAGYRLSEIPVEWHEIAGSKVHPLRDAWRMLTSLFRIRARNAGFTGSTAQALLSQHISQRKQQTGI